ncbi:DUF4169 family protein [Novispirillum itersonii]|uniref:DUF4169 family protein n=1 Tax=Novispirillum itersonii TaxID=189 RepID=UPI00036978AF|nr:DUF4169 family protein [Novispirillum itersonii]
MAEVINLRQARKQKARTEKEAAAAANRVAFGRTKAEKRLTEARNEQAERRLDGHLRTDEDSTPTDSV